MHGDGGAPGVQAGLCGHPARAAGVRVRGGGCHGRGQSAALPAARAAQQVPVRGAGNGRHSAAGGLRVQPAHTGETAGAACTYR